MEDREHALLQHRLEVDEHVSARDQIEMRERRIAHEVLAREHAQVAHRLENPVAVVFLDEEALQPFRRDHGCDPVRVASRSRSGDRDFTQIRREDLDRGLASLVSEKLEERDRDRVRLLATRASRYPHANRLLRRVRRHHRGEAIALQDVERVGIPEEARHANEQVLVERVQLVGILAQVCEIVPVRILAVQQHPPEDAALNRPPAIPPEVHLRPSLERHEDLVQLLELLGRRLGRRVPRRW